MKKRARTNKPASAPTAPPVLSSATAARARLAAYNHHMWRFAQEDEDEDEEAEEREEGEPADFMRAVMAGLPGAMPDVVELDPGRPAAAALLERLRGDPNAAVTAPTCRTVGQAPCKCGPCAGASLHENLGGAAFGMAPIIPPAPCTNSADLLDECRRRANDGSTPTLVNALSAASWVLHAPGRLGMPCSEPELAALFALEPARAARRVTTVFGKTHPVPRGERLYLRRYRFSDADMDPLPLPNGLAGTLLRRIIDHATAFLGVHSAWLSVLVNFYADGKDSIGRHADDEPTLRPGVPVLVYSYGAARDFVLHPSGVVGARTRITLKSGDFIAMGGACQREFQHEVPKRAHAGLRVSVTVRAHI